MEEGKSPCCCTGVDVTCVAPVSSSSFPARPVPPVSDGAFLADAEEAFRCGCCCCCRPRVLEAERGGLCSEGVCTEARLCREAELIGC